MENIILTSMFLQTNNIKNIISHINKTNVGLPGPKNKFWQVDHTLEKGKTTYLYDPIKICNGCYFLFMNELLTFISLLLAKKNKKTNKKTQIIFST